MNQKAKLLLAVVAFLLLTPLTIYYVLDGAGVFDTRSRAGETDQLSEKLKPADLNADNVINITDFGIWLTNFRNFKEKPEAFNAMADLNGDEAVTISDFAIWLGLWREYKALNNTIPDDPTPDPVESPLFGTGADGDIVVTADTNINTASIAAGRSCADAKSYNVVKFDSDTVVQVNEGVSASCLKAGDEVLVLGLSGTATNVETVGNYETFIVSSVAGDKITFATAKTKAFGSKAIVQRVPHYKNVSVASGKSLYPSAWDGTSGGVLFFRATGKVSVEGTIHADGMGYRGGAAAPKNDQNSKPGEGAFYLTDDSGKGGKVGQVGFAGKFSGGGGGGASSSIIAGGVASTIAGSTGGGGGGSARCPKANDAGGYGGGGGGGGNATGGIGGKVGHSDKIGETGTDVGGGGSSTYRGYEMNGSYRKQSGGGGGGGATLGAANLSKLTFGGGGGGAGAGLSPALENRPGTAGTNGGGIIYISANEIVITGIISAKGLDPVTPSKSGSGEGGAGAGGSIKLVGNTLSLGANKVLASGGVTKQRGGAGGAGRIAIQYMTTFSGSTQPISSNSKI